MNLSKRLVVVSSREKKKKKEENCEGIEYKVKDRNHSRAMNKTKKEESERDKKT